MGKQFVLISALHTARGWREGRISILTHSPRVKDTHKNFNKDIFVGNCYGETICVVKFWRCTVKTQPGWGAACRPSHINLGGPQVKDTQSLFFYGLNKNV